MSQQCIQQVAGLNTKYTNKIFYVRYKVKLIKVHVKFKKKNTFVSCWNIFHSIIVNLNKQGEFSTGDYVSEIYKIYKRG